MHHNDKPFINIPGLPATTILNSIRMGNKNEYTVRHTNLQTAKRKKLDIAEIHAALAPITVSKVITYPMERLAYFETIAAIETELQIRNEWDFRSIINDIHTSVVEPAILKAKEQGAEKTIEETAHLSAISYMEKIESILNLHPGTDFHSFPRFNSSDPAFETALEIYFKIKANFTSGKFKPSEAFLAAHRESEEGAVRLVTLMAIEDQLYRTQIQAEVIKIVNPTIDEAITKAIDENKLSTAHNMDGEPVDVIPLKRLNLYAGADRHTFLLAGAPASGKSTISAMIFENAKIRHNVDETDVVKINTDTYRSFVSAGCTDKMGEDKFLHSSLDEDEALTIKDIGYRRMQEKIKSGQAPHMLIDGVAATPERIELGTANNGNLEITIASAPPEVSVERAHLRGLKKGRFAQTDRLIESHKKVTLSLYDDILPNKSLADKSIIITVYDTNVPFGATPNKVAFFDLTNQKARIYDEEKLAEFRGKRHVNSSATSASTLFSSGERKLSYSSEGILREAGYQVQVEPATPAGSPSLSRGNE